MKLTLKIKFRQGADGADMSLRNEYVSWAVVARNTLLRNTQNK